MLNLFIVYKINVYKPILFWNMLGIVIVMSLEQAVSYKLCYKLTNVQELTCCTTLPFIAM